MSIFLPFHTVLGVLKARILKWFAIPFSSGPYFVRTLHHDPSICVALHSMAHSFTELDKAVIHVTNLVSFLWLWFSFCLPSDGWGQEAYGSFVMGGTGCGEDCFGGQAILSKTLIQFSADGWGYVPSLYFGLRPNYSRVMATSSKRTVTVSVTEPVAGHCQPTPLPATPENSRANLAQSLVLIHQRADRMKTITTEN